MTQETQMQTDEKPGPRPGRWRWLLALSLALNLLVLGMLAGAHLLRPEGPGRNVRFDLSLFPYTEALTREDRAALLRDWRGQGPDGRQILADRRAEQQAVLSALRADPFDAAALDAVFEGSVARSQAQMALGQQLLRDRLTALDPGARAAYAARLEEVIARGPRMGRPTPEGGAGNTAERDRPRFFQRP